MRQVRLVINKDAQEELWIGESRVACCDLATTEVRAIFWQNVFSLVHGGVLKHD